MGVNLSRTMQLYYERNVQTINRPLSKEEQKAAALEAYGEAIEDVGDLRVLDIQSSEDFLSEHGLDPKQFAVTKVDGWQRANLSGLLASRSQKLADGAQETLKTLRERFAQAPRQIQAKNFNDALTQLQPGETLIIQISTNKSETWCTPCRNFDKDILTGENVRNLSKAVIWKIDRDADQALTRTLTQQFFPTQANPILIPAILVFNRQGTKLYSKIGYAQDEKSETIGKLVGSLTGKIQSSGLEEKLEKLEARLKTAAQSDYKEFNKIILSIIDIKEEKGEPDNVIKGYVDRLIVPLRDKNFQEYQIVLSLKAKYAFRSGDYSKAAQYYKERLADLAWPYRDSTGIPGVPDPSPPSNITKFLFSVYKSDAGNSTPATSYLFILFDSWSKTPTEIGIQFKRPDHIGELTEYFLKAQQLIIDGAIGLYIRSDIKFEGVTPEETFKIRERLESSITEHVQHTGNAAVTYGMVEKSKTKLHPLLYIGRSYLRYCHLSGKGISLVNGVEKLAEWYGSYTPQTLEMKEAIIKEFTEYLDLNKKLNPPLEISPEERNSIARILNSLPPPISTNVARM